MFISVLGVTKQGGRPVRGAFQRDTNLCAHVCARAPACLKQKTFNQYKQRRTD